MPGSDVIFNVRERGSDRTGRSVNRVGREFTGLGHRARRGGDDLRLFTRASVSATGHLRLLGGAALYGGAAVGGVLVLGLKKAVDEYEDARKVGVSSNAVIKSTGGVANVTAKHVNSLSMTLSRKAGLDDEAIARGENMLLTFRKIRNEVGAGNDIFDQAAKTVVDLSAGMTAMGKPMSVSSAAVLLGKALNDPARGASALGRTGAIDKATLERIKQMADQGASLRTLQKFVLREVNAQFGGQAASTATSLGKLKVGVHNVEESIGRGLSPVTDAAADKLTRLAEDTAPRFDALGRRLSHVFDRKDLDFTQKLGLAGKDVTRTLRPLEHQLGGEIKKLHLGEKLADGVELAIPRLADAFVAAGPAAVKAFIHGFEQAGPGGKLLIAWFTGKKLGLGAALPSLFGKAGLLGRGNTPLNPLFVEDATGSGIPGSGGLLTKLGKGAGAAGAARTLLRIGGRVAPWAIAADALIDPDSTGGRKTNGQFADTVGGHKNARGQWSSVVGSHRERNPAKPGQWLNVEDGLHLIRDRGVIGRGYRPVPDKIAMPRSRPTVNHIYIDGKRVATVLSRDHGQELSRGVQRALADKDARR